MKIKKIIALISVAVMLLTSFAVPASAAFGDGFITGTPGEFRRTVEGYAETVARTLRRLFEFRNNYSDYTELCAIPETENGYVPQGYCFSETLGLHIVSAYRDKEASALIFVDAKSCVRVKTVNLTENSGEAFKGHAGGIATDEVYLYIANGKKINRVPLAVLALLPDGSSTAIGQAIETDVKCSYLSCDGEYLYAGEFYTYETDGGYDTDISHHRIISLFETSYSVCNAYKLEDVGEFYLGKEAIPDFVLATPNCVQGFARQNDGSFALSTSFGRNNDSFLKIYADVTKTEADFTVNYGDKAVNGYFLGNADKTVERRLPPMLEGIDCINGKITGIFESGAQKYSDSAFIVNSICEF